MALGNSLITITSQLLGRTGHGIFPGPRLKPGTFFLLLPHTPTHSFRKPKCSLSRHISFVSRKKYANDLFLHFSAESLLGRLGWRHRVPDLFRHAEGGGGEHRGGLNPNARLSLGISLSQPGPLSTSRAPPAPRHTAPSVHQEPRAWAHPEERAGLAGS